MWVFLTARLRRWLVMAVAVPLGLAGVGFVRRRVEARYGANGVTRSMAKVESLGARRRRRRFQR